MPNRPEKPGIVREFINFWKKSGNFCHIEWMLRELLWKLNWICVERTVFITFCVSFISQVSINGYQIVFDCEKVLFIRLLLNQVNVDWCVCKLLVNSEVKEFWKAKMLATLWFDWKLDECIVSLYSINVLSQISCFPFPPQNNLHKWKNIFYQSSYVIALLISLNL